MRRKSLVQSNKNFTLKDGFLEVQIEQNIINFLESILVFTFSETTNILAKHS